jgi:hypothetical protein
MKEKLIAWVFMVLIMGGVLTLGISWDIYKWHQFQKVTHSDIGFWKWHFLFNPNKK